MASFYIPYAGKKPAPVTINGHRLLILSREEATFEETLSLMGADRLIKLKAGDSREEEDVALNKLARTVNGGVVLASADIPVQDVIRNLESQLPWLQ